MRRMFQRRDPLRQNGLVTGIDDGKVTVSLAGGAECSSCSSRNSCFSFTGSRMRRIEATLDNTVNASVGDLVEVELRPLATMTIIAVTFLLPVAALLIGYVIGAPAGAVEGAAGAGIGLAIGITAALLICRKLTSRRGFDLEITRIVDCPDCHREMEKADEGPGSEGR